MRPSPWITTTTHKQSLMNYCGRRREREKKTTTTVEQSPNVFLSCHSLTDYIHSLHGNLDHNIISLSHTHTPRHPHLIPNRTYDELPREPSHRYIFWRVESKLEGVFVNAFDDWTHDFGGVSLDPV